MPIDHCGVNLNGQGFQVEFYDLLKICHALPSAPGEPEAPVHLFGPPLKPFSAEINF